MLSRAREPAVRHEGVDRDQELVDVDEHTHPSHVHYGVEEDVVNNRHVALAAGVIPAVPFYFCSLRSSANNLNACSDLLSRGLIITTAHVHALLLTNALPIDPCPGCPGDLLHTRIASPILPPPFPQDRQLVRLLGV